MKEKSIKGGMETAFHMKSENLVLMTTRPVDYTKGVERRRHSLSPSPPFMFDIINSPKEIIGEFPCGVRIQLHALNKLSQ